MSDSEREDSPEYTGRNEVDVKPKAEEGTDTVPRKRVCNIVSFRICTS
jgi:hypothetical protein